MRTTQLFRNLSKHSQTTEHKCKIRQSERWLEKLCSRADNLLLIFELQIAPSSLPPHKNEKAKTSLENENQHGETALHLFHWQEHCWAKGFRFGFGVLLYFDCMRVRYFTMHLGQWLGDYLQLFW